MNKNGLGHRPAGEWAFDEDDLERQAELDRKDKKREEQGRNNAP